MSTVVKIDVAKTCGQVRPLHGIDNGPVSFGALIDNTHFYQVAGFPYIRLHDTNYPHPREVDIPQIFPNFDADENDPANYVFKPTDIYLQQCLATGAQIIYRLGVSIEHTKYKLFVDPPKDFNKWAAICCNIIRHYNEGWANGFHWDIKYWEIWNEPDNQYYVADRLVDPLWSGSPEQYYDLYAVASRAIKKEFPNVKVGGYGTSRLNERYQPYFQGFLKRVKEEQLPLDFFSWHRYADDPEEVYLEGLRAEAGVDSIGYGATEMICDEWNYWPSDTMPEHEKRPFVLQHNSARKRVSFTKAASHAGTSFCVGTMIRLHDTRCAIATHYDGAPTNYFCSIFDRFGYPGKQFYAFVKYRELYERQQRLHLTAQAVPGFYAMAAGNAESLAVLLTSFHAATTIKIDFAGIEAGATYRCRCYLTDNEHCHQLLDENTVKLRDDGLALSLAEKGTMLVLLEHHRA